MNQNGGIHKGGFAVLCHRNGGSESPGILNYYREDDGMVTQVKVVTDFYYDSDRTAYCDTTTVIYEGKFPW